ncbi:hypothetical protein EPA93_45550 [Ktedonosporobacter rubrisoli]|uniref:Uncharacterized protein n=1 Tax=Ktedonosporobacter rubrisoli TaxID=2509675 RepID=A0A4P6K5M4_KTERU|nr:hypothetical protein [Ktedonosporobacter rubrisoli]QBD82846.1 hypothetical protein EPA93_45550 [Ktedonosporobacter rubrisoli]
MDHRYGRHGPHAWKRWREHRFARRSILPASVAQVMVIHVHMPIEAERIIIIMAMPEDFDEEFDQENTNRELQSQPNFGEISQRDIMPAQQYPFPEELRAQASMDAMRRVHQDVQNDPEQLPSEGALRQVARLSAIEHIKAYITTHSQAARYYDRFIPIFMKIYLEAYNHEVEDLQLAGVVLDERTLRIRQVVRTDKDDHLARNKHLSPEYLRYLAAARAMRDEGLDTALSLEDLDTIHSYVEVYCPYYWQYIPNPKEGGQFRGPEPF